MKSIVTFIKNNSTVILHIIFTVLFSGVLSVFLYNYPHYKMIINFFCCALAIYYFYKILFKKSYFNSFVKILCILSVIIVANRLYLYEELVVIFPWLTKFKQEEILIILTLSIIVLLLVFKLLSYSQNKTLNTIVQKTLNSNQEDKKTKNDSCKNKQIWRIIGVIALLSVFVTIPLIILIYFIKYGVDLSSLEFDKIIVFFASYSAVFLLLIIAIVVIVIAIIHSLKYIYILICSFKDRSIQSKHIPTYVFSVVIVCILLYLSWQISDLTIDELTNFIIIGDYLALPIAAMIAVALFLLLVHIIHSIILLLSGMKPQDISNFIKIMNKKLKVVDKLATIVQNIVAIILDTVISTLSFIKFVPNFFGALSKLVLNEDNDENENDT